MDRKLILTFIAMGIGILVVTIDMTAINVALPAIEKAFDISLGNDLFMNSRLPISAMT